MSDDRIIDAARQRGEETQDRAIRPRSLAEYVGQEAVKSQLGLFIEAARNRGEALDHVLVFGPPGLGKTTLAQIIAAELGVNLRQTSGPVLERTGDLWAILTQLQPRDVLFIDEIHRLSPVVEEVLYPAMEDFQLDMMIGEGPTARSIKLDLAPFTLVGATTRAGLLTSPLRDRFGIVQRLDFYSDAELARIVARSAGILGVSTTPDGSQRIAERSRGTPRIANRLLRRVRDFAQVRADGTIDRSHRRRRARPAGSRSEGHGRAGPSAARHHRREVRRGPGGDREPGCIHRRGARHAGGCRGTLPHPARSSHAHGARSHGNPCRIPASGTGGARQPRGRPAAVRGHAAVMSADWPVRVYYEDTDAGGVVYHAGYLRYLERARTEWLRELGYSQARLRQEESLLFTVVGMTLDFLKPARLDDLLRVCSSVRLAGGASVEFEQEILARFRAHPCRNGARRLPGCSSFRPRRLPATAARSP